MCGGRREVKRETWARARAEARVPMRRVRGSGEVGGAVIVRGKVWGGKAIGAERVVSMLPSSCRGGMS